MMYEKQCWKNQIVILIKAFSLYIISAINKEELEVNIMVTEDLDFECLTASKEQYVEAECWPDDPCDPILDDYCGPKTDPD